MASFTDTGLDTSSETLNNGEFGFVAESGELVVDGADAVTGSGTNRLLVNGTLGAMTVGTATHSAYDFDGASTNVIVGQSGLVVSLSGDALDLVGTLTMNVTNNGSIVADGTAIRMQNLDSGVLGSVVNSGVIDGLIAIRIQIGDGPGYIANSGIISSRATTIFGNGTGRIEISNSGTIVSADQNAITIGSGDDFVLNTGIIMGGVNTGSGDDMFDGSDGVQAAEGFIALGFGNDTFLGGAGAERITGGGDSDEIFAGGGNDTINGDNDFSDDLYDGGEGVDLIDYGAAVDVKNVNLTTGFATGDLIGIDQLISIENVTTGDGNDTVTGNEDNNLIRTHEGDDRVFGEAGRDRLRGGLNDDTLNGGDGNDHLFGEEDSDRLFGDTGNDVLVGGLGRDVMTGGDGIDHFAFLDTADSGTTGGTRDRITDFEQGVDKIDVSGIDANAATARDDEFTFIGTGAFTNTAGELRFRQSATLTIVEMDIDGDGVADSEIRLDGVINLVAGDFVL